MAHKEKFNLKEGESICPDCGGTGKRNQATPDKILTTCTTCWGAGKLDWVEMIMGKKPPYRTLSAKWTIKTDNDLKALFDVDVEKEIVDRLAEQISNDIDKQLVQAATKTIIPVSVKKKKIK